jgi:hypothetical protein
MSARHRAAEAPLLRITNRTPAFAWGLMTVFLGFVCAFAWLLWRDGPQPGQPAWLQYGALAVVWIGGGLAGGHVFRIPCTRLSVLPAGSVVLTRVWPLRRARERIPRTSITSVNVAQGRDSEGDPYFQTLLILATGREILVSEGHDAPTQEATAARLRAAIGLAAGGGS